MADDVPWSVIEAQRSVGRDGGALRAVRLPGASDVAITAFAARFALPLTGTYVDFLRASDGADLFGVPVLGTRPEPVDPEAYGEVVQRRLVPFHDWGNGDFDCLDLTKTVNGEPPVCFWSGEGAELYLIANGFGRWTRMMAFEVATWGALLHPREYADPRYANAQGVYEGVANVRKTLDAPAERAARQPPERGATAAGSTEPTRKRDRLLRWLGRGAR